MGHKANSLSDLKSVVVAALSDVIAAQSASKPKAKPETTATAKRMILASPRARRRIDRALERAYEMEAPVTVSCRGGLLEIWPVEVGDDENMKGEYYFNGHRVGRRWAIIALS